MASSTDNRPLAPAPVPVLAGVVASALLIAYLISIRAGNDWLAVFAFVGTVGLASIILDRAGRAEAVKHPHRLYTGKRLPTEKSFLRTAMIAATLLITLAYIVATADPAKRSTPTPYFVAVIIIYLVIPQIVARRVVGRDAGK